MKGRTLDVNMKIQLISLSFSVMTFNFHEEDRPAEKVLDLPALYHVRFRACR
jgi:hypothetical protein